MPDGILGAPGLGYVRDWILTHTRVLASIDLHPDTFQPSVSVQTSVLVLQRKIERQIALEQAAGRKNDYNVFMAVANHIGHDKRGNKTYVRDKKGNEINKVHTVDQRQGPDHVFRSAWVGADGLLRPALRAEWKRRACWAVAREQDHLEPREPHRSRSRDSSRYLQMAVGHPTLGRPLALRFAFGSSVPEIAAEDLRSFPIARLSDDQEAALPGRWTRRLGCVTKRTKSRTALPAWLTATSPVRWPRRLLPASNRGSVTVRDATDAGPRGMITGTGPTFGPDRGAPTPSVRLSRRSERAEPITYNNGYWLHMASGLLSLPEVRDVAEAVRRASES